MGCATKRWVTHKCTLIVALTATYLHLPCFCALGINAETDMRCPKCRATTMVGQCDRRALQEHGGEGVPGDVGKCPMGDACTGEEGEEGEEDQP